MMMTFFFGEISWNLKKGKKKKHYREKRLYAGQRTC